MSKENVQKSRPRKNLARSSARSSSKFLQKTDTKFKTTTLAPYGARPIFGVVVLNFESVFWRNLLEFLAELLAELLAKFFLGLDFLTVSFDIFSTFSSVKKLSKPTKIFLGQIDFLIKTHGWNYVLKILVRKNSSPGKIALQEISTFWKISDFVKTAIYKSIFFDDLKSIPTKNDAEPSRN